MNALLARPGKTQQAVTLIGPLGVAPSFIPRRGTKRSTSGFTLIELLVVISIIALLASLLMPAVKGGLESAKNVYCVGNMKSVGSAILHYASDHKGMYPSYSGRISWDDQISGYDGRPTLSDTDKDKRFLEYDNFGPQLAYLCPSFEDPDTLNHRGTRAIPRAYALNYYRPTNGFGGLNWGLGVSGSNTSRNVSETRNAGRTIVLLENYRSRARLGDTGNSTLNGPTYRNGYSGPNPGYTTKGPHSDGRLANFFMADGHVEALDFVETSTNQNTGQPLYAGGDWRYTMWDAGSGVKRTQPLVSY